MEDKEITLENNKEEKDIFDIIRDEEDSNDDEDINDEDNMLS